MTTQADRARRFLELHDGPSPLLMPNPWDVGSARLLASLGFDALATTSSGSAATLGRVDGGITGDEALSHAASIVDAVDVPVSADLENCFADDPDGVARTVQRAIDAGLAGCSVEDFTRRNDDPIYELKLAVERVAAAVETAHTAALHFVITARTENYLHGRRDIDDTIARLVAFRDAGADALFAPGANTRDEIKQIVDAVRAPVNVLAIPGTPSIAELADLGVKRVSVGGAFAYVAYGAAIEAARELKDSGTYSYWRQVGAAREPIRAAFSS